MDAELSNAVGITPARAGKRDASLLLEKLPYGSPPRGQGKVLAAGLHNLIDRITPAWAGKRGPGPVKLGRSRDHPRVGGEKLSRMAGNAAVGGSPPRGRGKVCFGHLVKVSLRITPAWAGKRSRHCTDTTRTKDHPRVGGEKLLFQFGVLYPLGSPPHGRGKVQAAGCFLLRPWITPAWAGKIRPNRQKPAGL